MIIQADHIIEALFALRDGAQDDIQLQKWKSRLQALQLNHAKALAAELTATQGGPWALSRAIVRLASKETDGYWRQWLGCHCEWNDMIDMSNAILAELGK